MLPTNFKIFSHKVKSRWLFSLILTLSMASQSSLASLAIMIYHNETMYIASDSAATQISNGERTHTARKIYQFSENCCAAITGFAGFDVTNTDTGIVISLSLPDSLRNICAEQMTNTVSLDQKMKLIAARVNQDYANFFDRVKTLTGHTNDYEGIMLQFVGYNAGKDCFFVNSCKLERTNAIQIDLAKEYRGPNDPMPITCQGEVQFLQTLLSGDKPELLNLLSDKFTDTAQQLVSTEPVSDSNMINFILEMFSLHTSNSARLGYSQGWVGPPYRIFKLTKQKVVELSPAITNSAQSVKPN
jgi:hypothetical protein